MIVRILSLIGQRTLTGIVGWFARWQAPKWLLHLAIRWYVRKYRIDLTQFAFDWSTVKTFNEFFTRHFKEGMRPFARRGVASPAEGYLYRFGRLTEGLLIQCKGEAYPQAYITGTESMQEGSYVTIYLSPGDYHRVHAPVDMTIEQIAFFPGRLFPVNERSVERVKSLYCINERVVLSGKCAYGRFEFVFIGAMIVGKILLSFVQGWAEALRRRKEEFVMRGTWHVRRGEELGYFEIGSTVIFIVESDVLSQCSLEEGARVLLGQHLCG